MKTNLYFYFSLALLLAFAATSCKKTAPKPNDNKHNNDIYVAGHVGEYLADSRAMFWKNNVPTTLSNETSLAFGVAVQGTDVYTVGSEASIHYIGSHAVYWKNNSPSTPLTDNTEGYSVATSVIVQGNDVYITGSVTPPDGNQHAVYWKNGKMVILDIKTGSRPTANGIVIKENDVYVSGYYEEQPVPTVHACYWKNGAITTFEDQSCFATGIAVDNNSNIYLAGVLGDFQYENADHAVFWKNGAINTLSVNEPATITTGITANGNDIYIIGNRIAANFVPVGAICWKNSIATDVPDSRDATAIALSGSDVYITGAKQIGYDLAARLWLNNALVNAEAPNTTYSAICVVKR